MEFVFKNYLKEQLEIIKYTLEYDEYTIYVEDERQFIRRNGKENVEPNSIYVVVKSLSSTLSLEGRTQPISILIMSEENSLDVAKQIAMEFSVLHNGEMISGYTYNNNETLIKQEYGTPVVINAFETMGVGYRAQMVLSATLYIMEDVAEVTNFSADGVEYEIYKGTIIYNMTANTQQMASDYISSSEKQTSSLALNIDIPLFQNAFITKIANIVNETLTGNDNFVIGFTWCGIDFSVNMKLIHFELTTQKYDFPTISIGLMR